MLIIKAVSFWNSERGQAEYNPCISVFMYRCVQPATPLPRGLYRMPTLHAKAACPVLGILGQFPFTWAGLLVSVRQKGIALADCFVPSSVCVCRLLFPVCPGRLEAPLRPRAATSGGPAPIWERQLWLHPSGEVGSHPRVG